MPITSAPLRFPDFLGIGAQKAGTSWLHVNLGRHPSLWLPPVKELHYFNDLYIEHHRHWILRHRRTQGIDALNRYLDRGVPDQRDYRLVARLADYIAGPVTDAWYGSLFTLAGANQTCGEITPEYCLVPDVGIEHVLRLSPDVKILFALRDPIERSWSHMRMQVRRSEQRGKTVDVRQVLTYEELEQRANYPELIARWRSRVADSRLFLMFFDDIQSRPQELMEQVCRFLEVDFELKLFPKLHERIHGGHDMAIPDDVYETLRKRLRPIYDEMLKLYPDIARRWIAKHYPG
jgi:hypothetical protein